VGVCSRAAAPRMYGGRPGRDSTPRCSGRTSSNCAGTT
jgi:hypothetical protein